jgi:hypothetical protein
VFIGRALLFAAGTAFGTLVPNVLPTDLPETSKLVQQQEICALALATLIISIPQYIEPRKSHYVTLGEAWRPDQTAALFAKMGIGIKNSNHTRRLAMDFNLRVNGKLVDQAEQFRPVADLWARIGKSYGLETAWGGDFKGLVDGPHFSCVWRDGSEVIK